MPSTRVPTTITPGGGPPPVVGAAENVALALNAHVTDPTGAHAATAISYAAGPNWADATTNPASNVQTQIDKMITDLAGSGGSDKLGHPASLSWADGTTNPADTLGDRLDKIFIDLALGNGARKIAKAATGNWADGTTNPADTLGARVDKIITDLAFGDGAGKIRYDGGSTWADGTTNPATTVGAQIDKIITDLAGSGGTAKVGGAAYSGVSLSLTATTLLQQLKDIVDGLCGLASSNTCVVPQTTGFWDWSEQTTAKSLFRLNADGTVVVGDSSALTGGLRVNGAYTASGVPGVALQVYGGDVYIEGNHDLKFATGASTIEWRETTLSPEIRLPQVSGLGVQSGASIKLVGQPGREPSSGNTTGGGVDLVAWTGTAAGGAANERVGELLHRFGNSSTAQKTVHTLRAGQVGASGLVSPYQRSMVEGELVYVEVRCLYYKPDELDVCVQHYHSVFYRDLGSAAARLGTDIIIYDNVTQLNMTLWFDTTGNDWRVRITNGEAFAVDYQAWITIYTFHRGAS